MMSDTLMPATQADQRLSGRAKVLLSALALVTLVGVGMVWLFPNESVWHFVIVTQLLPLIYCVLTYWASHAD